MASILYTTTESVRAAIGLSTQDIDDQDILNTQLDFQLEVDLAEWLPSHSQVQADGTAGAATPDQIRAWKTLQLFCMYYAGYLLADTTLGMRALQKISDGVNEGQRFNTQKLEDTKRALLERSGKYRRSLETLIDGTTLEPISMLGIAAPNYNLETDVEP